MIYLRGYNYEKVAQTEQFSIRLPTEQLITNFVRITVKFIHVMPCSQS